MRMKLLTAVIAAAALYPAAELHAVKNKVAQSGMTYLAISMGARETALGDAGTATVRGIGGMWHNPAVLADIESYAVSINQVSWLIDTRLYGAAVAHSFGNWGTVGLDVTYMDFGEIMGTKRVDKSVDYRGFVLTGDIGVEDYAVGLAYSRRISDKFALGFKIKRLHENLGRASYVVDEYEDPETGEKVRTRMEKEWSLDDWGIDFGTVYDVGWNGLVLAMTMQNLSRDMKYWYEEFQAPMVLRMGLALNLTDFWTGESRGFDWLLAVDALHPNDHTERVHVGTELTVLDQFALRGGYKFNHEIESLTLGLGLRIELGGMTAQMDYAYGTAEYFSDIHRMTFNVLF